MHVWKDFYPWLSKNTTGEYQIKDHLFFRNAARELDTVYISMRFPNVPEVECKGYVTEDIFEDEDGTRAEVLDISFSCDCSDALVASNQEWFDNLCE